METAAGLGFVDLILAKRDEGRFVLRLLVDKVNERCSFGSKKSQKDERVKNERSQLRVTSMVPWATAARRCTAGMMVGTIYTVSNQDSRS